MPVRNIRSLGSSLVSSIEVRPYEALTRSKGQMLRGTGGRLLQASPKPRRCCGRPGAAGCLGKQHFDLAGSRMRALGQHKNQAVFDLVAGYSRGAKPHPSAVRGLRFRDNLGQEVACFRSATHVSSGGSDMPPPGAFPYPV